MFRLVLFGKPSLACEQSFRSIKRSVRSPLTVLDVALFTCTNTITRAAFSIETVCKRSATVVY